LNTLNNYRYILKPYKGPASRHTCPSCGRKHKFSRYIDTRNGNELADHVGRCDREDNCGYHYTPKQFSLENPEYTADLKNEVGTLTTKPISWKVDYLPFDVMNISVVNHKGCCLYPFLSQLFRSDVADFLCNEFFIGRNKDGNTVFWQVDVTGKIRQCKIIKYLPDGHRNKDTGAIFGGKKILNIPDADLQQCFFGEYQLAMEVNQGKPIAIVESEKTAVIATVFYPDFVWLATGGKNGAKWTHASVCKVLAGKKVVLFPDVGAFDSWKSKGLLISATAGCRLYVSDLLEKNATNEDRVNGLDLADYLLRVQDNSGLALTENNYPVIWDFCHH
jgi:hypothetical protein